MTDTTPVPFESEISVAIAYPGNRVKKVAIPLMATDMDVTVKPRNPYKRDIVLLDNADKHMIKPVMLRKLRLTSSQVVYRMRGDVYRELETWNMPGWKKKIALDYVLPGVDGAISVNRILADKLRENAGIRPSGVAGLAINESKFPNTFHTKQEINAITLTNADYERKIKPIIDWSPVVNDFLEENGGEWIVGGEGTFDFMLQTTLKDFENVHYGGYLNKHEVLEQANVMLHPSNLDGLPNSILEGMASNLPVITNDFEAFMEFDGPLMVVDSDDDLLHHLELLTDPEFREKTGNQGNRYVQHHHTGREIGKQYVRYFQRLLGDIE